MILTTPTPLQILESPFFKNKKIQLWIKRDDLTHPHLQGNKWRKLKYNLAAAKKIKKKYLLTFGGAFSNHLYATAAAGQLFDFETIGIVRGEKKLPLNPTLAFAEQSGMKLFFVDRKTYALKEEALPDLLTANNISLEECYVLPEGGTNDLALQGCGELAEEIYQELNFSPDYICVSCGTGGTVAGIIQAKKQGTHVLGFSALKGDFLKNEVQQLLEKNDSQKMFTDYSIQTDYHFGGYAKHKPELLKFINEFKQKHQVQLEPIYTGKMFYGIFDLIEKNYFPQGSKIVAVHTGGLQGIAGFRQRFGNLI